MEDPPPGPPSLMSPAEAFAEAHAFYAKVMAAAQYGPAALQTVMTEEQTIRILMATNVLAEDVEHRIAALEPSLMRDTIATMWLHVKMVGVLRSVNELLLTFNEEGGGVAPGQHALDDVFARTIGPKR